MAKLVTMLKIEANDFSAVSLQNARTMNLNFNSKFKPLRYVNPNTNIIVDWEGLYVNTEGFILKKTANKFFPYSIGKSGSTAYCEMKLKGVFDHADVERSYRIKCKDAVLYTFGYEVAANYSDRRLLALTHERREAKKSK